MSKGVKRQNAQQRRAFLAQQAVDTRIWWDTRINLFCGAVFVHTISVVGYKHWTTPQTQIETGDTLYVLNGHQWGEIFGCVRHLIGDDRAVWVWFEARNPLLQSWLMQKMKMAAGIMWLSPCYKVLPPQTNQHRGSLDRLKLLEVTVTPAPKTPTLKGKVY